MRKQKRGWAIAFCVTVLRRPLLALTKRDWRGAENVPSGGGCVVAVNHVSEVDPFPFAHFIYNRGRLPRFLGKADVFKIPIAGKILTSAGQIPVYRKTEQAAEAFSAAVAAVERGECVIIYPEGTISRDPGLWPMVGKTGAARVALTTGCPVIPCAQWGPQEILAPYARVPHLLPRKLMQVRAGKPVDLRDLQGKAFTAPDLILATERIMAAITELLAQIRGEQAPARRFDPVAEGVPEIGNPRRISVQPVDQHRVGSDERIVQVEPVDISSSEQEDAEVSSEPSPREQPS
ncbi:MAG: 1-acyl-sn-glycerol-3-phosphate acyltransferase [Nocardioidaceae bacterium]|nr:1-acyl-sn-glycerol-3-phosphate acyltransferase [Nocardioidaceae bacterium]